VPAPLALVAALTALQVPPLNPCPDPAQALRCPDLVMGVPTHLSLDRKRDGRRFLRMENKIVNIGTGPAELFARRIARKEMTGEQVITDAAGGRRRIATGAEVYYTSVPTRGGDYWKFDQAARFELWSQLPDGRPGALVRVGPKLRYCLRDLRRIRGDLPRAPRGRVFGACNQRASKREVTLGTSVGWADIYPASYPGNVIDVTGLRGCFVIRHVADPQNHIFEINEANNVSVRVVRLPYKPGRQGCPAFVPA
jgi:hypothetical protein